MVDGDPAGRAVPEIQMNTLHLGGIPLSPFSLATEDNLIYHPVRRKAERLLAELPEVGLETYRAEVDGQVQALLGALEQTRDEAALASVAVP